MIQFKPVRLEDRSVIERYTMPSGITNCDLAFANMYCWQEVFRSAWAEVGGFLVIRFQIGGGKKIGYMQPVGPGDFAPIIPLLREDAHAHGQRLRIIGLTDQGRDMIRRMHVGEFAFESDRALEDYIYAADDLRNLPGRRYQPKRNHMNRFTAEYPDYRYEQLQPRHFDECMRLEREWRRAHEGHTSELCAEQRAMQRAFENFDALGMLGGALFVGDRLAAFTYGSAVNDHTFDTHVEKADIEFDGAFTAINKLFAEHLPARFTLINREEDLGLDGLRRAKLSYHPVAIAHKFTAIRLHPDEIACKELWQEAFGDDDAFTDAFLIRYYSRRRMLGIERDGHTVAMLHLLPFRSALGRTTYIYGVATAAACRGQGLATKLMHEAMERIAAQGDDAAVLIPTPGQQWLRAFYERFGFAGDLPACFRSEDGFDFGTGDPATDRAMVWRRDASAPLPEQLELTCAIPN
ncbi:GNAT family N-acetyltransferase [Alistipes sp.]|uniref:GNAT family N-acetyltransferase n=1 Tax=Alistipes sp. TaxID=1872444 RepID=UPI003AF0ECBE